MTRESSNELLDGPVLPALVRMALPAAIGYFFNTIYNVVDTYWGGQLSTDALAGLSLSFPVFGMLLAVAVGTSAGSNALIANYLGAGDEGRARYILAQSLSFGVVLTAVLSIPLLIFLRPFLGFLGGGDGAQAAAFSYARVLLSGAVFFVISQVWNSGLQARGDTKTYRNILVVGFFVNVGLDPLLMYGWHPAGLTVLPGMGVEGIALATVLVQAGGILYVARRGRQVGILTGITIADFRPRWREFREIMGQALPGMLNFLTMAAGTFVITSYVGRFGTSAVAGYGAAIRIEQIALVPTIGLNIALATMVGQSNGAARIERIRASYRTTLLMGLGIYLVMYPWIFFFGHHLIGVFNSDADVMTVGAAYLQIQAVTFYSYVILFQANSILQGLKKPGAIFWIGLYRQLGAPLGVFTLLAFTLGMGVNGVWWGLAVVNWSAAAFTWWWSWRRILQREREVAR
ncbi:MAG: MATE family efflux transporter [Alkalispirochaeta sp.]